MEQEFIRPTMKQAFVKGNVLKVEKGRSGSTELSVKVPDLDGLITVIIDAQGGATTDTKRWEKELLGKKTQMHVNVAMLTRFNSDGEPQHQMLLFLNRVDILGRL